MEMDNVKSISNEQLMLILGSCNSIGKTSNEMNFAFSLMMQNLLNEKENNLQLANDKSVKQEIITGQNLKEIAIRLDNSFRITYNGDIVNKKVNTNSSDEQMKKIYNAVNNAAIKYKVDPNLILAIIKHESDFQPGVTSSAGATGLMQIMPENYSDNDITDGYDIDQNVNGGTKLLRTCLDLYGGDLEMGLMAYAAGPGTMKSRGVTCGNDLYKMPAETKKAVPEILEEYKKNKAL